MSTNTAQSMNERSTNDRAGTTPGTREEQSPTAQTKVAEDTGTNGSVHKTTTQLAHGLGWFSLGLGLAEFLAPRSVAKVAGIDTKHTALIRMFGLREMASGVGIFMQRKPAEALWSRVAGDALDLACLGAAFVSPPNKKGRLAFATASVLGVTAADVFCAKQLNTRKTLSDKPGILH